MEAQVTAEILRELLNVPDPRTPNRYHLFGDILTIALFAVIAGADGWVQVESYGQRKKPWLKTFLELPYGIPSHDTFGRVFAAIDPEELEKCFLAWMSGLVALSGGKLVAIDGKSLRRSFEHAWDKSGMAHMVSAFVAANKLVFAQVKTLGKGQELDGIERLLQLLDLQGAVVTIDALGCNRNIAERILQAKGDYLLQVKANQETLQVKMQNLMKEYELEKFAGVDHDYYSETDGDHGRIETRRVWVVWDVKDLGDLAWQWPELQSLVIVQRTRDVNGVVSCERHYYISSLGCKVRAKRMAEYVRGHWSVENNLHWQLDISFKEDQRRIRKGHGAENFSRLCRIALNLLKREKTNKKGIDSKRKDAGWDDQYMLKVIAA